MHVRRRWAGVEVRYCSAACRGRRGLSRVDRALEAAILSLLAERGAGKTICPSEAARHVAGPEGDFRRLMERTRQAARRLVADGAIVITQGGRVVDPSHARGPIRLRAAKPGDPALSATRASLRDPAAPRGGPTHQGRRRA